MRRIFRLVRRLLAVVVTLVLLAAAAVGGLIWASFPGGDLAAHIAGLSAPVAIAIDADDIPHVRAASEADAAAALGFLHARERLFQMDLMRRAASGELAALVGPPALPIDRFMRTLGLRHRAVEELAGLPADTRTMLDAYARGVNAWIAARGRFAASEFVAFGAPRPWSAVDSLLWGKTMALYLAENWRTERARLLLDAKLPPAQVDELWPPAPGNGHPEAALAPSPALTRLAEALARAIPDFPAPFTLPHHASNAWAVDGRHSATGAPLLAGDPHLAFNFPSFWYLARLDWPGGTLAGATAPGVPFLVLGHNAHIAWSFTTTGADTEDLFVETPADATHYQTPDGPKPYLLREERIHVRGGKDETLLVRETRHGPVISDIVDPKGPVLALEASYLLPDDSAATGLLALNRARDVAAAGRAAAEISAPVQNLMVADHDRIGLFVTGRVPIRRSGDGARPVEGADGRFDWTGFAAGDQLPHYAAPDSGRLVNANERVAPPDFPVFMGRDWFADWRAQRIRELLRANEKHSVADFAAMQADVVDPAARALLPILRRVAAPEGTARSALALLQSWDGTAARDAPQPLIFTAWMQRLYAMLLDRIGVPPEGATAVAPWPTFLPYALSPAGAHWCGGDCGPLLADSLAAAATDLARRFGPDPATWRWGAPHRVRFSHPILGRLPLIGTLTAIRIATPGDDETIDRGGAAEGSFADIHGPEFRGVYDLADLDRSLFVVAPGQSGNPFSGAARNFVQRWRDGASVMLPAQADRVATRITLAPAEASP
ncbi:MAG TPA: penicillin acylase family protein [Acetobacteraceae bacterium]|nr:penicillin acylase family protein [Acetobacteraceae bacterium]